MSTAFSFVTSALIPGAENPVEPEEPATPKRDDSSDMQDVQEEEDVKEEEEKKVSSPKKTKPKKIKRTKSVSPVTVTTLRKPKGVFKAKRHRNTCTLHGNLTKSWNIARVQVLTRRGGANVVAKNAVEVSRLILQSLVNGQMDAAMTVMAGRKRKVVGERDVQMGSKTALGRKVFGYGQAKPRPRNA